MITAVPMAWLYFATYVLLAVFIVVNLFIAVVLNNLEDVKAEHAAEALEGGDDSELLRQIEDLRSHLGDLEAHIRKRGLAKGWRRRREALTRANEGRRGQLAAAAGFGVPVDILRLGTIFDRQHSGLLVAVERRCRPAANAGPDVRAGHRDRGLNQERRRDGLTSQRRGYGTATRGMNSVAYETIVAVQRRSANRYSPNRPIGPQDDEVGHQEPGRADPNRPGLASDERQPEQDHAAGQHGDAVRPVRIGPGDHLENHRTLRDEGRAADGEEHRAHGHGRAGPIPDDDRDAGDRHQGADEPQDPEALLPVEEWRARDVPAAPGEEDGREPAGISRSAAYSSA